MATGKKGSSSSGRSTKKTTTRKTNSRSRQTKKQIEEHENFTNEIVLWTILALATLLFISNFGIGGKVGNVVSGIFFGIFGFETAALSFQAGELFALFIEFRFVESGVE